MPLRVKQPFVEKNTYYQHFAWWTTTTGFSKLSIYITLDKFFLRQMDAVVSVNLLMPNIGGKAEKYFVENGIPPLSFDVASIASTDPEVLIVGDGPQREFLQALIKENNLEDKFYFAGYRKAGYNYLKCLEVFCLPSLTEGLPVTILEAMQPEVPIVASKVKYQESSVKAKGAHLSNLEILRKL